MPHLHVLLTSRRASRFASWSRHALRCGLALTGLVAGAAGGAPEKAPIEPPPGAQVFEIAAHSVVNGVPMQIFGFISPQDVSQTLAWFKSRLGPTVAVNQVGVKQILGRPQGSAYLTVELESAQGGSKGTITVADWAQARAQAPAYQEEIHQLQERFGANARVLQHLESMDGPKRSNYIVVTNDQPVQLNASEARRWLERQGLRLERTLDVQGAENAGESAAGVTSFFRGPDKEAMVVATRDAQTASVVVINLVETAR